MLDPEKAKKLIHEHFERVTPESFEANLREYCPDFPGGEQESQDADREVGSGLDDKKTVARDTDSCVDPSPTSHRSSSRR